MFKDERSYKTWNSRFSGMPAFTAVSAQGYYVGAINGIVTSAHRVIFKMAFGYDPVGVDHGNGTRTDNRLENLREADQAENSKNSSKPSNNTSGAVGVYWLPARKRWMAAIKVSGRQKCLGYFHTFDEAKVVRLLAQHENGFHPNHGR
jgi:hypothetical protein